jgi:cyclopropane-fatty-acyl-phospholipid synthase
MFGPVAAAPRRPNQEVFPMSRSNSGFAVSQSPATHRPPVRAEPGADNVASAISACIAASDHRVFAFDRWLVRKLLHAIGSPPIRIVLWNGEESGDGSGPPMARIAFHDRTTLLKVLLDPHVQFGEAFSDGRLEVEGDLEAFLETIDHAEASAPGSPIPAAILRWLHRARANTLSAAKEHIEHHYDIGDDFYRLWLDDQMIYSGAYFTSPTMTLEEAQQAKLNYVCRKLGLRAGETVVEVGGGWGALGLLMARDYGVTVKSFNISHSQILYGRLRAQVEGLNSRIEFIEDDYRNISGQFDALVSLGMLEHVGRDYYREFGRMMGRCLRANGRGLIQTIGQDRSVPINAWIERRIFPGAYPPTLSEMGVLFEPWGFSILDVENLRLHYAETLRRWRERFEASVDTVAAMFDEQFVRLWRLYLAGSQAAFAAGTLQLFQVLFARSGNNEIPTTHAAWYN